MEDIKKLKDDIVKVLFYINLILLAISIFVSSKALAISVLIVNIVFNGTFMVICKWGSVFQSTQGPFAKSFGKLGKSLDYFTNMGQKNGKI